MPSPAVLVGCAALALAVAGAVGATTEPEVSGSADVRAQPATAHHGTSKVAARGAAHAHRRDRPVSRAAPPGAPEEAADRKLEKSAAKQARERSAALGNLEQAASERAEELDANQWVAPLAPVSLTARFGETGLWASSHTGLDFNGSSGQPIRNVANGVVTSAGYDGAYGNKTVVTLEDGTEVWYAHQTSIAVNEGDTVAAGDVIGSVGATGNVTGSHLHLEVRPGGGDPVDPYQALAVRGVTLG